MSTTSACTEEDPWLGSGNSNFILFGVASVFLVLFGGVMSGLTSGMMQLDENALLGMAAEGSPKEMWMARWLLPLARRRHMTLVTLLIGNALAMEALPIFLDVLVPKFAAILLSVTLVVFFGEVIPQGMCLRYPNELSAHFAWLVYTLMLLLLPVVYPIAKLLDHMLGAEHARLMNRAGLWNLARQHSQRDHNGPLQDDELAIISGALTLYRKVAGDVMMPLDRVYALSVDDVLDDKRMIDILNRGYSRVPVYEGTERAHIVGFMIVKQLARVRLPITIRDLCLASPLRLSPSHKVYDLLAEFRSGSSHVAVIEVDEGEDDVKGEDFSGGGACPLSTDEKNRLSLPGQTLRPTRRAVGIVTLEDVLESLLQMDIRDETDTDTWAPSAANHSLNNSMDNLRSLRCRVDDVLGGGDATLPRPQAAHQVQVSTSSSSSSWPSTAASTTASTTASSSLFVANNDSGVANDASSSPLLSQTSRYGAL